MQGRSVRSICDDPDMPARETLHSWLARIDGFSHHYAQALEFRTHLQAEQRHEIIEDAQKELFSLPQGVNASAWANLVKEQIRAIEWDAERMAAKRYKPQREEQSKGGAEELAQALQDLIANQPS